ncbi:MAG TPA: tRNA (adenosine(37)-N6)-threonylcarbamoyltransferase complex dimerization subunit type 1 TsaB [Gemmatimonadales bacterium]|jgi:tRNA threonylcarbamoyladenosine biosynthesis protein TsaB
MWLAIDTATDRASVALGLPGSVLAEEEISGARRHASHLLPTILEALRRVGAGLPEIEAIVLADGPGSFTGLRVGAAVAKALVESQPITLWSTPSLLSSAAALGQDGRLVLAVSDALRGELFAAAYRVSSSRVDTVLAPSVHRADDLNASGLVPQVVTGPAADRMGGVPAWPSAATLLRLIGLSGGVRRTADPRRWEPEYGRPAEAQVQWERTHGRPLPNPASLSS